jgi:hypothetical protein
MSDQPPKEQQLQINTGDEMSRGRYSNNLLISHTPDEFVFDWLLNSPTGVHLVSRVIVSPGHFKRIMTAMTESLQKYENQFGPVKVIEAKDQKFVRTEDAPSKSP